MDIAPSYFSQFLEYTPISTEIQALQNLRQGITHVVTSCWDPKPSKKVQQGLSEIRQGVACLATSRILITAFIAIGMTPAGEQDPNGFCYPKPSFNG